jgi:hypothetical protein
MGIFFSNLVAFKQYLNFNYTNRFILVAAEMYQQQPFYHHHSHISSSASHGTLRSHCSTFVGPHPQPQQPQHQQPTNGKNHSLTLSASMLSNGNSSCNVGSKSDYVPLRSSADNLLKQHQMVRIFSQHYQNSSQKFV